MNEIPKTQTALQLTGPNQLTLNTSKPVHRPGPYQILCKVEAAGLCFSDLKLLKQFHTHARKTKILSGIEPAVLKQIPSYVPDNAAAVPGHEAVVRICQVGENVERFAPGQRYLVQTDYRWLPTANSNGSFGYNFEGALQQYVLMDERIITSPDGESMLIPVPENLSAAAIALVEPWACVEDAYATKERRKIKTGGKMLVAAEQIIEQDLLKSFFEKFGKSEKIIWLSKSALPDDLTVTTEKAEDLSELPDAGFDDVIYFGSDAKTAEALFAKTAAGGLYNIVLCGGCLGRAINCTVGRVHYGGIRITGTAGNNPAESMANIPATGEIREGDKINIVGAAGPMGVMHVIRDICAGTKGVQIFAGDLDEQRLAILDKIAEPLARKHKIDYNSYKSSLKEEFDYTVIMAPIPALVTESITYSRKGGIINIFAGLAADVNVSVDMDAYISKGLYFIGTSGSVLDDMKTVLKKVQNGQLDTNLSVTAVCGLEGAADGIKAVENHSIAGKIIVYPDCKGLKLTSIRQLARRLPQIAEHLADDCWTIEAENALLQMY